jgi:vacuolar-type H+-ATPase subunit H
MSEEITNGAQEASEPVEGNAAEQEQISVDFTETNEAVEHLSTEIKGKGDLESKGAEKTTTPKYTKDKDYVGDEFWTDTTNGERLYDQPEDADAIIETVSDEAQKAFAEAIINADKQIAASREAAITSAQSALSKAAQQAFGGLDEGKRNILTNDILNSQMPNIIKVIDSGQAVNWNDISLAVANEIEQRIELYNLREQEQAKIDEDKKRDFPLETQSLTGVQGIEGAKSRMNWTRAQDENFIQQLASKLKPFLRGNK